MTYLHSRGALHAARCSSTCPAVIGAAAARSFTSLAVSDPTVSVVSIYHRVLGQREDTWPLTKNRRYEAHYDALNDARIAEAAAACREPGTLPMQAYGPNAIYWARHGHRPTVWAWINWRHGPATKIPAVAAGWNDRVVVVEWWDDPCGQHSVVVWRGAVTHRAEDQRSPWPDKTFLAGMPPART